MKHRLTITTFALAAFAFLTTAAAARADETDEEDIGMTLPLTFKALEWGCETQCLATAKDGALLCLSGSEGLSCNECEAAWVGPTVVAAAQIPWKILQGCGQMVPSLFKANLVAINKQARGAARTAPLFDLGLAPQPKAAQRHESGPLTLVIDATTMTLTSADAAPMKVDWYTGQNVEPTEEVAFSVYALKDGFLAAVVLKVPDYVVQRTLWFIFSGAAKAAPVGTKPDDGNDPATIAKAIAPWLDGFCGQTLKPADFEALKAAAASGAVSQAGLVALFNAHGALYGYAFKKELWLNDFFAARELLPASCRPLIGSFKGAGLVPTQFGKDRDALKAIWKAHR